jgi:amidase
MSDLPFCSATRLTAALAEGEISSRELLDLYLARVEALDPKLGAVVTLDAERARRRADEADAARARGERWGPLHGLPITVKDCWETAGLRTTCGVERLKDHVPETHAVSVQRLVDAGAVLFGKTNTPAWTLDWQTYNDLFGITRNPWDPERTSGGSSGGSAAAVAAGLTGLELGSDIGGSIRVPSHCCGVYGHKPTWGIVPLRGHVPGPPGALYEKDINVAGPLARAAEDLALALDVLAGPLPDAARAWRLELPPPRHRRLADFRVAAWLGEPGYPVADTVRERHQATVEALRRAGAQVDETARPDVDMAHAADLFHRLLAPITADALADDEFAAVLALPSQGQAPFMAEFSHNVGLRHRDWLFLHDQRERLRAAWARFFQDWDVLLCPVLPIPAIPHDLAQPMLLRQVMVNGEVRPYVEQVTWLGLIGCVHLPATVAPVGNTPEGLPVGIQIVAPHLEDRSSIEFARLLHTEVGGFEPPPGFDSPTGSG